LRFDSLLVLSRATASYPTLGELPPLRKQVLVAGNLPPTTTRTTIENPVPLPQPSPHPLALRFPQGYSSAFFEGVLRCLFKRAMLRSVPSANRGQLIRRSLAFTLLFVSPLALILGDKDFSFPDPSMARLYQGSRCWRRQPRGIEKPPSSLIASAEGDPQDHPPARMIWAGITDNIAHSASSVIQPWPQQTRENDRRSKMPNKSSDHFKAEPRADGGLRQDNARTACRVFVPRTSFRPSLPGRTWSAQDPDFGRAPAPIDHAGGPANDVAGR